VKTLAGHTDWVRCVVQLADGRVVSGSCDKTLRLRLWVALAVAAGACVKTQDTHSFSKHVP
jgi:WD40 repeat protein